MADKDEDVRYVGNYELGETLGKGGYSWVKKGIDKKSKKVVALKFMTRADSTWEHEQAQQVKTEIKSMIKVRSPHVMKLYAYNLNAQYPERDGTEIATILLVLEYCPGGELFDILYYSGQLAEKTARSYFRQMIIGLGDCHAKGIIHRDIKPQNLLMDSNYQLKITDFGLSYLLTNPEKQEELMKTFYVGTRGYQAPELLSKKKYTKKCDFFSCGVVLFILLTGYPPFDQAAKTDKWYRPLYKGDTALFWKQHKGCGVSDDCKTLIEGMLCYKPANRLTIEEVMKHKWYLDTVWTPEELKKELKSLHKKARNKRKNDKKKMLDMADSVKKRDIPGKLLESWREAWGSPAQDETELLTSFSLPVKGTDPVEKFLICKSIFEGKKMWDGKAQLKDLDKEAPFELEFSTQMLGKDTGGQVEPFGAKLKVSQVGDKYVFNISRMYGKNVLKWNSLYGDIEDAILANKIFDDASQTEEAVEEKAEE